MLHYSIHARERAEERCVDIDAARPSVEESLRAVPLDISEASIIHNGRRFVCQRVGGSDWLLVTVMAGAFGEYGGWSRGETRPKSTRGESGAHKEHMRQQRRARRKRRAESGSFRDHVSDIYYKRW